MHIRTALINWHDRAPVFSCDFHSTSGRLATCGADKDVKLWTVLSPQEKSADTTSSTKTQDSTAFDESDKSDATKVVCPSIDFTACLRRHRHAVNVVRFSRNGEVLASGGDDGVVNLWKLDVNADLGPGFGEDEQLEVKEKWRVVKSIRAHSSEIYDISWSPKGDRFAVASIDNSASVWTVSGKLVQSLKDHQHYVQGVAWDPRGEYILTQSSDQTVRVYAWEKEIIRGGKGKGKQVLRQNEILSKRHYKRQVDATPKSPAKPADEKKDDSGAKGETSTDVVAGVIDSLVSTSTGASTEENKGDAAPAPPPAPTKRIARRHKMFQDESTATFFRRLSWSPDGSIVVIPTGQYKATPADAAISTAYTFVRNRFGEPAYHLPGFEKPVVAVRFSPVLYKLREGEGAPAPLLKLPYRMVYAVASVDSVAIYDTQHRHAIGMGTGIHYASITDLSWSRDGGMLAVSSSDGYCSFAWFDENGFGDVYPVEEHPECMKPAEKKVKPAKDATHATAGKDATATDTTRDATAQPEGAATVNVLQPRKKNATATPAAKPEVNVLVPRKKKEASQDTKEDVTATPTPEKENASEQPQVNILQPRSKKKKVEETDKPASQQAEKTDDATTTTESSPKRDAPVDGGDSDAKESPTKRQCVEGEA